MINSKKIEWKFLACLVLCFILSFSLGSGIAYGENSKTVDSGEEISFEEVPWGSYSFDIEVFQSFGTEELTESKSLNRTPGTSGETSIDGKYFVDSNEVYVYGPTNRVSQMTGSDGSDYPSWSFRIQDVGRHSTSDDDFWSRARGGKYVSYEDRINSLEWSYNGSGSGANLDNARFNFEINYEMKENRNIYTESISDGIEIEDEIITHYQLILPFQDVTNSGTMEIVFEDEVLDETQTFHNGVDFGTYSRTIHELDEEPDSYSGTLTVNSDDVSGTASGPLEIRVFTLALK